MHSPPPKPRLPSSSSPAVVASASPYGGGGGGGSPYHRQRPTYQYQGGGTTTTAAAASSAPPTPMPVPPSPAPYGGYSNNNSSAAGLYGGAMAMPSPSGPKGGTIGGAAFYGAPGGNDYAFANHSNGNNGHNSYSYEEDDDKYSKKNRKKSKNNASSSFSLSSPSCRSLLGVTAAVLCLLYSAAMTTMWMTARGQAYKLLKDVGKPSLYDVGRYVEDLKRRELEQRDVVASAWNNRGGGNTDLTKRQQQQQVTTLERQNKLLVKERDEWKARHEKSLNNAAQNDPHRVDSIEKDHHRLTKREAAFSDQIRWFMAATRRESKRGVLERYVSPFDDIRLYFDAIRRRRFRVIVGVSGIVTDCRFVVAFGRGLHRLVGLVGWLVGFVAVCPLPPPHCLLRYPMDRLIFLSIFLLPPVASLFLVCGRTTCQQQLLLVDPPSPFPKVRSRPSQGGDHVRSRGGGLLPGALRGRPPSPPRGDGP